MVVISFPDAKTEKNALGFLAKRFPLTTWASGLTSVPEPAMSALAAEGITFTVEGRAAYEQRIPALRNLPAPKVQRRRRRARRVSG